MIDKSLFTLVGMKARLVLNILLSALVAGLIVIQAMALSYAIVEVWPGGTLALVGGALFVFALAFVLKALVRACQTKCAERFAMNTVLNLEEEYLHCVLQVDRACLRELGLSSAVINAVEGTDLAASYLEMVLVKMSSLFSVCLLLLVAVFCFDPLSGVILLALTPFVIIFMILIGHSAHDEAAKKQVVFKKMSNHFIDTIRGLPTLRAFGRSESYAQTIFDVSERYRHMVMKTIRVATLSSAVLDLFAVGGLAAVAIMLGFRMVEGSVAFFSALTTLLLVPDFFLPIRSFAADYHATLDGKNSLTALRSVIEGEGVAASARGISHAQEMPESPGSCAPYTEDTSSKRVESITLSDVSFSYSEGVPIIDGFNQVIEGRGLVVLKGPSGAGKTTLLDIISGVVRPCAGTVLVNGKDEGERTQRMLQEQCAYIPQHPFIFQGTIKENILFYANDATDDALERVIEKVGLAELVSTLPKGIDTVIGDGNRGLSGGEAHRVALARALLDDHRRIWIMDEPTAHLDVITELEFKKQLLEYAHDRLIILATHRSHWECDAKQIIALSGALPGGRGVSGGAA